jgi:Glycosyl hydrolase 109, C-terminal domain/Oxidoreductase family, NAD-binding Rossmann fold
MKSKNRADIAGRRNFMKMSTLGGIGVAFSGLSQTGCISTKQLAGAGPDRLLTNPPMDRVKIGFVGIGGMGSVHVMNLLDIPGADIVALCDINVDHAERAKKWVVEAGNPEPTLYTRGETDFVRMCETEDLDLVFNATPWKWHIPVCVSAMENGKHTAVEVPAAMTIDECWQLVETAEKFNKHCVMMENCNYSRNEMRIFNMARLGMFGELLHAECGYLHDLRGIKLSDDGEGLWRYQHSIDRDCNLYPTHGLGPIAQCMDINRGDQFDYLVSMSSAEFGLSMYAKENLPVSDPRHNADWKLGDINTCLIRTVNGRTIYVKHDTSAPRPYSRINMLQGTNGIFMDYPSKIHIAGRSEPHRWEDFKNYEEFEHPLWKTLSEAGGDRGHGSMDYIEDYRLIQCLREGKPTDMNVYDAAAISSVVELTEISVANKSNSVKFPDFTRGRWKTNPKLEIVKA